MKYHTQSAPDWKRVAAARLKEIRTLLRSRELLKENLAQRIYKELSREYHDCCLKFPRGGESGLQAVAQSVAENLIHDLP